MNVLKFQIEVYSNDKESHLDMFNNDIKVRAKLFANGAEEMSISKPQQATRRDIITQLEPYLIGATQILSQYMKQFASDELRWKERQFERFWDLYDKKVAKDTAVRKFMKLSTSEIRDLMAQLPLFVAATPDKQYRPHPTTFINQKRWKDEIPVNVSQCVDYADVRII